MHKKGKSFAHQQEDLPTMIEPSFMKTTIFYGQYDAILTSFYCTK